MAALLSWARLHQALHQRAAKNFSLFQNLLFTKQGLNRKLCKTTSKIRKTAVTHRRVKPRLLPNQSRLVLQPAKQLHLPNRLPYLTVPLRDVINFKNKTKDRVICLSNFPKI